MIQDNWYTTWTLSPCKLSIIAPLSVTLRNSTIQHRCTNCWTGNTTKTPTTKSDTGKTKLGKLQFRCYLTPNRLNNGFSGNKLILGIPTYGRAWKLDEDSGLTGVPPLSTDGAADPGPYTNEAGLLSYPEICNKIANQKEIQAGYLGKLRKVNDPTKRYGKLMEWVNK